VFKIIIFVFTTSFQTWRTHRGKMQFVTGQDLKSPSLGTQWALLNMAYEPILVSSSLYSPGVGNPCDWEKAPLSSQPKFGITRLRNKTLPRPKASVPSKFQPTWAFRVRTCRIGQKVWKHTHPFRSPTSQTWEETHREKIRISSWRWLEFQQF
jgi:hypothetical protein